MDSESYKIEVLHYFNPHLIWVEVVKPNNPRCYHFEQVGLYGLLPLEPVLDIHEKCLKTQKGNKWQPGIVQILKQVFKEAVEVWFSPVHIDRRTSVFDNNIHKYGEVIIKTKDNHLEELSTILTKTQLAYYDKTKFHNDLVNLKLKTKLTYEQTHLIVKKIEHSGNRQSKNYSEWIASLKYQTKVFHASEEFRNELTELNLEKHNKQLQKILQKEDLDEIIRRKQRDFDMCKDADDNSVSYESVSTLSEGMFAAEHCEEPVNNPPLSSRLSKRIDKYREVKKVESSSLKDDYKIVEEYLSKSVIKRDDDAGSVWSLKGDDVAGERDIKQSEVDDNFFFEDEIEYQCMKKPKKKGTGKGRVIPEFDEKTQILQAFGPPEVDKAKLQLQVMDNNLLQIKPRKLKINVENEKEFKKNDISAGLDDEIDLIEAEFNVSAKKDVVTNQPVIEVNLNVSSETKIPNKSIVQDKFNVTANEKTVGNKTVVESEHNVSSDEKSVSTKSDCITSPKEVVNGSPAQSIRSKRLLYLLKKKECSEILNNSMSESSVKDFDSSFDKDDSSNKGLKVREYDTSKNNRHSIDNSDNESTVGLHEKMLEMYKSNEQEISTKEVDYAYASTKVFVNPFKNVDANISKFIDKLVTPAILLHSKENKVLRPICDMRDINFNSHIKVALKSMSITQPMILQTISWFTILRGHSLFMVSPLGSGKTLGYVPSVCRLVSDFDTSDVPDSVGPVSVIVCATSLSVASVEKYCRTFLGRDKIVMATYSGMDERKIVTDFLNGCDVLVCTPSALVRCLTVPDFGLDLRRLATVVFDDFERLDKVYINEIKFFLMKVKDMLKNRASKEFKVQYVVASRSWSDYIEILAKKSPKPIICIGSFQECVLYSKAGMTINFVAKERKVEQVVSFLKSVDNTKRSVVICRTDEEIALVEKELVSNDFVVMSANNSLTVESLYNISSKWVDYYDPYKGPVLVCSDYSLAHLNVSDANNLVHYSLPSLYSTFSKRFSVLIEKYPSTFKDHNEVVNIKTLLDDSNVEQLPKIINFIKRCAVEVPEFLDEICKKVLDKRNLLKAEHNVPFCEDILTLGECPDYWNCQQRHSLFKQFDEPMDWLPKSGLLTFKILNFNTAVTYSARLLAKIEKGKVVKYPQTYSTLSLKMGMYYSKESNLMLHGDPKVGDVCALALRPNFYVRCKIHKILTTYEKNGNPNYVLVNLIDEEKWERTRDIYLFHLPEELKNINSYVVRVKLANLQPKDRDITFSDLARDELKNLIEKQDDIYMRANVKMVIGNCVLVEKLEACQDLSAMKETVVRFNFKEELLKSHAVVNDDHIAKLQAIAEKAEINAIVTDNGETKIEKNDTNKCLPKPCWAHLPAEENVPVYFASAVNPDQFFVRLEKFQDVLELLTKDIQKYVTDGKYETVKTISEDRIVLAKFPDDSLYYRARIDKIVDSKCVKCFFVDHGDWRNVSLGNLIEITATMIEKLPFQAIECKLLGLQPVGDQWSEFSTNWFCDQCFHDSTDILKKLYIKDFTKLQPSLTGGYRYGVKLYDTTSENDVFINKSMIEHNMAREKLDECDIFENLKIVRPPAPNTGLDDEYDEIESDVKARVIPLECLNPKQVNMDVLFQKFQKDLDYSSDEFELNTSPAEQQKFLRSVGCNLAGATTLSGNIAKIPAIVGNDSDTADPRSTSSSKLSDFEIVSPKNAIEELDSDDLSSPDCSVLGRANDMKIDDSTRKPKVVWRQNKEYVFIKIELIGVDKYVMDIKDKAINFAAIVHDKKYAFDLELYGGVIVKNSAHEPKGLYIYVKLAKILKKPWISLAKSGVNKWIVYDPDGIEVSDDDEEGPTNREQVKEMITRAHYDHSDDEEEDDDMVDDYSFY